MNYLRSAIVKSPGQSENESNLSASTCFKPMPIQVEINKRFSDKLSPSTRFRGVNHNNLIRPNLSISCNHGKTLQLGLLNARSVRNKSLSIADLIIDRKLDILAITETWLKGDITDNVIVGELVPSGYSILSVPRTDRVGGGVALIFRENLVVKLKPSSQFESFEYMEVELRVSASAPMIRAVLIYSPKPKSCDSEASDMFVEDFTRFMDGLSLSSSSPLIMGDFNYHVDDKDNTNTSSFLRSLDELNLIQHVPKPTHEQGHILDLVLSRPGDLGVLDIHTDCSVPSDHETVLFKIPMHRFSFSFTKSFTRRKLKSIPINVFKQDILSSELNRTVNTDLNEGVGLYDKVLLKLLDKHAPKKSMTIQLRPKTLWYGKRLLLKKEKGGH